MISQLRTFTAELESITPYVQSSYFKSDKKKDESHNEFEWRCWREKQHVNSDGYIIIPSRAFKETVDEAIKRQNVSTGNGKETYTKFFQAGQDVPHAVVLNRKAEDAKPIDLMCSSDGKKGKDASRRVLRVFPQIDEWKGTVTYAVWDDKIPKAVFEEALHYAGIFVGVGQHRPEKAGHCGRFKVVNCKWS